MIDGVNDASTVAASANDMGNIFVLVKPSMKRDLILANAPETRVNIMAALSLCLFDALDPRVSKKYIVRVRNSGMNVLTRLPNDLVEKTFRMLIRNLKSEDELNRIRDVYALYRSRTITRF